MSIDQFNIYSRLSNTSAENNKETNDILAEINKIKELHTANTVIEYLSTTYGVKENDCLFT